jgi:hypothetical protein
MEDSKEERIRIKRVYHQHHLLILGAETARWNALTSTDYEANNGRRNFQTTEKLNAKLRELLIESLEESYTLCKRSIKTVLNELPNNDKRRSDQLQKFKDVHELQKKSENLAIYDTNKQWAEVQRIRMFQIQEQMLDIILSNHGIIATYYTEQQESEK